MKTQSFIGRFRFNIENINSYLKWIFTSSIIILLIIVLSTNTYAQEINGNCPDWERISLIVTDPNDIIDDDVDLKACYVTNDDNYLCLRLDVYGNINPNGHTYYIYLDTDSNSSTGFTGGWWSTGADYRIYIDQWNIGLQEFMGENQSDDTWGWNKIKYQIKVIPITITGGKLECVVPKIDIGETKPKETTAILCRACPYDDSIPSQYNECPLIYFWNGFWDGIDPICCISDPNDIENDDVDIKEGYATNDESYLYLRLDVFGNINPPDNHYYIYLDTDCNMSTGFTNGWWTTGADYRIFHIGQWNRGLQKFMGGTQSEDTWGWEGEISKFKTIAFSYRDGRLECAVPRIAIGETGINESSLILFRAWPDDDSIPYYAGVPCRYDYKGDPMFQLPIPVMIAIDDVGWKHDVNVGDRDMELKDYEVIKNVGESVGHRIQALFIMGYFDANHIIDDYETVSCGSNLVPQYNYREKIEYVKDNAAYIEFGMHGNLHSVCTDIDGDGIREVVADEFYNYKQCQPWPSNQVDDHIECFERLIGQFDIPFPKSFVAPTHGYYWNPNDPDSIGAKLGSKGIKYVNNDFSYITGLREPSIECISWPKNFYLQEGGELDHGVLMLHRPYGADCPWNVCNCAPKRCSEWKSPQWPFVVHETHWTNWLNPDPNKNMQSPGQGYINWFNSINNNDERYLPKNTAQGYSQWLYRKYAKVTEYSSGTVIIDNIWQTPVGASEEKIAYDQRMKEAAYNNNLLGNLVVKRPLNGLHISSAYIDGTFDHGAQIVAYYEDEYGYGYIIIGHETEEMGRLQQDIYTLNYSLGDAYLPAYIDIQKKTYNVFSFQYDPTQCQSNLKLEMYGTQEVRVKLPFEPDVNNITSNNPNLIILSSYWDTNTNILSIDISGKNIQGEIGTITINLNFYEDADKINFISPVSDFIAKVGVSETIKVQAVDNCGYPVIGLSLTASFSNGDNKLSLTDDGQGYYSDNWIPQNTGPVKITINETTLTGMVLASWDGVNPIIGTDPNDIPDPDADIKAAYVTNDDGCLYLRLDVYGNINPSNYNYSIYLDTDLNVLTGFTFGWWSMGADYRIYIHGNDAGLQQFMGTTQSDDAWGWDGLKDNLRDMPIRINKGNLECAVKRIDIGETAKNETTYILYRVWPGDDSIPYYNVPYLYIYKSNPSDPMFRLPVPVMPAIDDAGLLYEGRYRVLKDYEVLKKIGEAVGHRLQALFIMGYFDLNNIMDDCGETVKPDYTIYAQGNSTDKIEFVKKNAAYIEFGMHGNLHVAFIDKDGDGQKDPVESEFYQLDSRIISGLRYNDCPGHCWPCEQVDDHIECFERLINQFGIPFPKSFVAPSHGYYWDPNDNCSTGAILGAKGVKYANNYFGWIDNLHTDFTVDCNNYELTSAKTFYIQEGGVLDHGVLLLHRPSITDKCFSNICACVPEGYPRWPFVFRETHWTNWLNEDPNNNTESPGQGYINWLNNINNDDERFLPKNTTQCYSQWLYRKYATVTEGKPGTVIIDNIWQTPVGASDEKIAYDQRLKEAAYNNNLLGNLVIKRPLNGLHISSASIDGTFDHEAQIVAYYEDEYGYGYIIIGHETEEMGRLKQDIYTMNYTLGYTYLPAYIDIQKKTYNVFSFQCDPTQCQSNLKLEMYGTQEVRVKLPFEPDVNNITGDNPKLIILSSYWDTNTNILSMEINGINIQGEMGIITINDVKNTYYFRDADGDYYGNPNVTIQACFDPSGYVKDNTDCDDSNDAIHPGAPEICDVEDNDCDGSIDEENAQGCITYYKDADQDSYGVTGDARCLCSSEVYGYTAIQGGDCNDADPNFYPNAPEICDGKDNNCNGSIDEENAQGCITYYKDADQDSYGVTGDTRCLCAPAEGYTASQGGDCDDSNDAINPGAPEICCDRLDNDCDGKIDNSCPIRGPISGIDKSTSYCFFYGKWDDCIINEVIKKFKLVILHPGGNEKEPLITPEQVARLKEAGVIVIGYWSIAEDYTSDRLGDGRGPVHYDHQNCCLIYENKGVASWYVDEVDPNGLTDHDGIPDININWGSAYVYAGDQNWQQFVKTATIASDGFAGTDYILNHLGCDGLFIDTMETASPWGRYVYTFRGVFDLLCKTSALYPEKYMVVNRPLFACDLDFYDTNCCASDQNHCSQFCFCDFSSKNEARNRFRQCVNAFVWESYSLDKAYPDFLETRDNVIECADNSDGCGFNVLVLDYYNLIRDIYPCPCLDCQIKEVQDLFWLDYIAPGPQSLDQIGHWVYNYLMDNDCDGKVDESNIIIIRQDSTLKQWLTIHNAPTATTPDIGPVIASYANPIGNAKATSTWAVFSVVAGDFDNDGVHEIAVLFQNNTAPFGQYLNIYEAPQAVGDPLPAPKASFKWIGSPGGFYSVSEAIAGDFIPGHPGDEIGLLKENAAKGVQRIVFYAPPTQLNETLPLETNAFATYKWVGFKLGMMAISASSGDYNNDGATEIGFVFQNQNPLSPWKGTQILRIYKSPLSGYSGAIPPCNLIASIGYLGMQNTVSSILDSCGGNFVQTNAADEFTFMRKNASGVESLRIIRPPQTLNAALPAPLAADYDIGKDVIIISGIR